MHLVVTKAKLKPNALQSFKNLFDQRVPAVLGQFSSWRGAEMSLDHEEDQVVVVGSWEDAGQMRECLATPQHGELIEELSEHFAGAPDVTITEVVTRIGYS